MIDNSTLSNLLEGEVTTPKSNPWYYVIFGVLLLGIIALFVWQSVSGNKQKQEAQKMLENLKKGDRVKTIGGICGFVVEINDEENTFVLETGNDEKKSYVKLDKGAIYQTAPKEGSAVAAENAEKDAKKDGDANITAQEKPAKKSKNSSKKQTEELPEKSEEQ